jgi:A/G-specific adenine glycosylase
MKSNGFVKTLLHWYANHKRDLPWRQEPLPYNIWLSEIILQQTQVKQGLPYYERFITLFPNVWVLARSTEQQVLKAWQGLGYYSRARNLHKAAQYICNTHKGVIPNTYAQLLKVPGIGPYTAAAIASIAFLKPHAVVDGNVIRVLARLYGIREAVNRPAGLKQVQALATQLLYKADAGTYNQAIMEFGALQCKPQSPPCSICPFAEHCEAHRSHAVHLIPHKIKAKPVRQRHLHVLLAGPAKGRYFMRQRTSGDVWQGLYEFVCLEHNSATLTPAGQHASHKQVMQACGKRKLLKVYTHKLSHQTFNVKVYTVALQPQQIPGYKTYTIKQIKNLPVSRLTVQIGHDAGIF